MNKYNSETILMIIMLALGFFLGYVAASGQYKKEAIDKGVAYYNPTNASFQWTVITNK